MSGGWCAELIWLNETDLVIITEVLVSDICHAWKYTYFKRNSMLYMHGRMHKLGKIFLLQKYYPKVFKNNFLNDQHIFYNITII